jgi:hypothetical protein
MEVAGERDNELEANPNAVLFLNRVDVVAVCVET